MKVLIIVDYYFPGYRSGGPLRTIVNMVENLGTEFEFLIITRDRDFGDSEPYANVCINKWNNQDKAKVFYANPKMFSVYGFKKIFDTTPHDILYLNSFFSSRSTGLILFLRRLGLIKSKVVVIAPRGEFSPGALAFKAVKKWVYIVIVKLLRLYDGLFWQASSKHEMQEIKNVMDSIAEDVIIAPDLLPAAPAFNTMNTQYDGSKIIKKHLRLVFLSRISPKKNLDYLLRILEKTDMLIDFSIYGPLEDSKYWFECERLIQKLSKNITVYYQGEVPPEEVPKIFVEQDVFFFPTHGENFGHVIFESLAAGTCVVLSDKTPWLSDGKAVQIIPLENSEAWLSSLKHWASRSEKELARCREAALTYAREYITLSPAVEQNRTLFQIAYKRAMEKQSCAE